MTPSLDAPLPGFFPLPGGGNPDDVDWDHEDEEDDDDEEYEWGQDDGDEFDDDDGTADDKVVFEILIEDE